MWKQSILTQGFAAIEDVFGSEEIETAKQGLAVAALRRTRRKRVVPVSPSSASVREPR